MAELSQEELDFLAKIEWEGGIVDALEYGLTEDDLPDCELRDLWTEVRARYQEIEPSIYRIHDLIEEAEVGR